MTPKKISKAKKRATRERQRKKPHRKLKTPIPPELKRQEIFEHHFTGTPKYQNFKPGETIAYYIFQPGSGITHAGLGYMTNPNQIRITHTSFEPSANPKFRQFKKLPPEKQKTFNTIQELIKYGTEKLDGKNTRIETIQIKPQHKRKRKRLKKNTICNRKIALQARRKA